VANKTLASLHIDDNKERFSKANYIPGFRPKGIIITDTYNNPFFPVRSPIREDSKKFDSRAYMKRYKELYLSFKSDFLAFHFLVEFVFDRYYVLQTRPITYRFPLNHQEAMERKNNSPYQDHKWDESTEKYMKDQVFPIEQAIHVCILGDSNVDVYTKQFYRMVGSFCIQPFLHYFRMANVVRNCVLLNMGNKINKDYIFKFLFK